MCVLSKQNSRVCRLPQKGHRNSNHFPEKNNEEAESFVTKRVFVWAQMRFSLFLDLHLDWPPRFQSHVSTYGGDGLRGERSSILAMLSTLSCLL